MIIKTEAPDIELHPKNYPNDVIKIYIRKNKLELRCIIDGAGNEFYISKDKLMEMIK